MIFKEHAGEIYSTGAAVTARSVPTLTVSYKSLIRGRLVLVVWRRSRRQPIQPDSTPQSDWGKRGLCDEAEGRIGRWAIAAFEDTGAFQNFFGLPPPDNWIEWTFEL